VNGKFEHCASLEIDRFSNFGKTFEWRDPDGVFWLMICAERGLYMFNPKTSEKAIIQNNPNNTNTLINNEVNYVYNDQENKLWIVPPNVHR